MGKIDSTEGTNDVQPKVEEPPTEKQAEADDTNPVDFVQASTDAQPKAEEPQTETSPPVEPKLEPIEACNDVQSKAEEPAVEEAKRDAAVVDRAVPVDDVQNRDTSVVEANVEQGEAKVAAMAVE